MNSEVIMPAAAFLLLPHADRNLLRDLGADFGPEGPSKIAQRFIAGSGSATIRFSSRRDDRQREGESILDVPTGLEISFMLPISPAVNCWAIIDRPSGTNNRPPGPDSHFSFIAASDFSQNSCSAFNPCAL